MRPLLLVALACALLAAGCTANGQDPYAYAKKPLYTGGFNLAKVGPDGDSQEFRVQDGSIASVRVQVWVNATKGGATVDVLDPSGRTLMSVTETTDRAFPLNLGAWKVRVKADEGSEGHVGILVTRG